MLLIRLGDDTDRLVLTHHLILWDGWSAWLFFEQLIALYERRGDTSDLPPPGPYRDYLAWLAGQDADRAAAAWRDALEGRPGLTELEDVAHVHDWAVKSGLTTPELSVVAGASWGGYLTLLALGTQPERWAAGIAGVPVADYVQAYADEMEPLRAFDRGLFGGSPEEVPEVYRKASPITYVDQVRAPVLVLAGDNDPRCPIQQILNYLDRLAERKAPFEFYRYDAGHGSLVVSETLRQVAAEIHFGRRAVGLAGE